MLRIDRLCRRRVAVACAGRTLLSTCHVADRTAARSIGLLGTRHLPLGEGVWITRCRSVHTMGLAAAIGVAFVDRDGVVMRVVDPLPRWRVAGCRGASAVVEAPAGTLAALRVGDRLTTTPPLDEA